MSAKEQPVLPDHLLLQLGDLVERRFGLHFPRERWPDLQRGLSAACREFCREDVAFYAGKLLSGTASPEEITTIASCLTVGETYFFRDRRTLDVFAEQILPALPNRQPRIWSAGCATGEEAYSIAILLSRLQMWNATVLATDLNLWSLRKAAEGTYREWSFRATAAWERARYFSPLPGGRWTVDPSIRKTVTFAHWNLADENPATTISAMDVVFCRNVLMYFSPVVAQKVVRRLYRTLNVNGWLIVSPAETSHNLFAEFKSIHFPNVTVYQKIGREPELPVAADEPRPDADSPIDPLPPKRDRSAPMLRLARACANRGKLTEALRWCDKITAAGAVSADVYYLRAIIFEEQGCLDEACRSLRSALFLSPDLAIAHYALGHLALKRGRNAESAKHFGNALQILATYGPDDVLPQAGGLTAARVRALITRHNHV